MQKAISVKTDKKRQLVDITEDVEREIAKSEVAEGAVIVFVRHTTCALIISEFEDNLEGDLLNYFEKEGPKGPFSHSHGDFLAHDPKHAGKSHTPAHILSAAIGQSVNIPLKGNRMLLGTWQRICLAEFDGPREREIIIQLLQ
ncbi:MAG TPA: secondary thiamine-phosphate synthase enzyme YjbQ [Patescibacteria group bacterium]|nr:secondary thiamine-phosphate synthase enzyme YjbQ [Patescibacteria group bacterium]